MTGLAAEEIREFFLELNVERAGTVGDAGAGRTRAPFEEGRAARFDDFGVKRQPEIIIAREHNHLAASKFYGGALLGLHGVVVGGVFQPHLGRVIIATAGQHCLFIFGEEGERHEGQNVGLRLCVGKRKGGFCRRDESERPADFCFSCVVSVRASTW